MSSPFVLFEVSWEVCNMVGGIHTVLSTKAKTATQRLGDDYIAVGPWLLAESEGDIPFDEEGGHEEFCESCRSKGVAVRVGRWRTPGSPRTILVEFSRLYEHKDDVLSQLWENFEVDSISGGWDYVEPVLFGHAVGIVIERWWEDYLAPTHRRAIVHAHEWMTGSSLLYLKKKLPSVGTVFTTHATMLGRALSSLGNSPSDGLGDRTPKDLADEHNVTAKHSIEGVCAREADVFTTVSEITADEAELLHRRRPKPLLPNGIDLDVIDEIRGSDERDEVRRSLFDEASRFVGEDVSDAILMCVSGRYEFHNKGVDLLLDALADINDREGRRVVLFVLIPAGNSGVKSEVLERRDRPIHEVDGPVGICTHNLFDEEQDAVHNHCQHKQLLNEPGGRVKIIQVPIYIGRHDGFFNRPYEAVLGAMDLSCFPSYYEPWGYTPQESLAVGVPTVTSDYAGFGRWAASQELSSDAGITVLSRFHVKYKAAVDSLISVFEDFLASNKAGDGARADYETCRATADRTSWRDLFANYEAAYTAAMTHVEERSKAGVPQRRRPKRTITVHKEKAPTPRLTEFEVTATLPESLVGLKRLALNYWWCWDPDASEIFAEIAPEVWRTSGHNPIALLQQVDPERLSSLAEDSTFTKRVTNCVGRLENYLAEEREAFRLSEGSTDVLSAEHPVAYFSAEFGIHESLPIYSGGLGMLAGDHLKSASDLGLPLVGVGLFYRMGYMGQRLTSLGEQTEVDIENVPHMMPVECVRTAEGAPLEVLIQLPGRQLYLRAWRARVGRVSLYLLDANTPSNRDEDRNITRNLYGGDSEMRLLQEIALGRGGARLLRRLGVRPAVYHMNEGHAAFLTLERVSRLAHEEGLTFEAAREIVRATTLFTTHTPVPAGHDRFDEDLMRRYFSDAEEWVGVRWERFFDLGQGEDDMFNMTHLGLSFASWVNGVSKLHRTASRKLLRSFWPGLMEEEVPVNSVTNGIHLPSWTHPRLARLINSAGQRPVTGEDFEQRAPKTAAKTLWTVKQELKRELLEHARVSLEKGFVQRNDSPITLHRILEGLDENALFIGFARRFAPYKRAHLIFSDMERLQKILSNEERPVRVIVAGKAHPRDQAGKDILRDIAERTRDGALMGKVLFLEDYNMNLGRAMVQGVDVWLNNPIRMLEASGTSGMKAAANATLNLSIGDGWWPEAHDGQNGWTIAGERVYEEQELQDQFDSASLYRLLEEEIIPLYFERGRDGVPKGWAQRMLHDLQTIPVVFNTNRMVLEYFDKAYRKLARNYNDYTENRKAKAKHKAREAQRIRRGFAEVKVLEAHIADLADVKVGDLVDVRLDLDLGPLAPEDVEVELVVGQKGGGSDLDDMVALQLRPTSDASNNGTVSFEGTHRVEGSGRYAHGLRIRARQGSDLGGAMKDLVFWA